MRRLPGIVGEIGDRLVWALARRLYGTTRIYDVDFIYVGDDADPQKQADVALLTEAIGLINDAGDDFGALLRENLHFVATGIRVNPWLLPHVRGYVTRLTTPEATNSTFLACRLLWAAKLISLRRAKESGSTKAHSRMAHAEALRFVRRFPDSTAWERYLQPDNWTF